MNRRWRVHVCHATHLGPTLIHVTEYPIAPMEFAALLALFVYGGRKVWPTHDCISQPRRSHRLKISGLNVASTKSRR